MQDTNKHDLDAYAYVCACTHAHLRTHYGLTVRLQGTGEVFKVLINGSAEPFVIEPDATATVDVIGMHRKAGIVTEKLSCRVCIFSLFDCVCMYVYVCMVAGIVTEKLSCRI